MWGPVRADRRLARGIAVGGTSGGVPRLECPLDAAPPPHDVASCGPGPDLGRQLDRGLLTSALRSGRIGLRPDRRAGGTNRQSGRQRR